MVATVLGEQGNGFVRASDDKEGVVEADGRMIGKDNGNANAGLEIGCAKTAAQNLVG
jgi:hypothetical protein